MKKILVLLLLSLCTSFLYSQDYGFSIKRTTIPVDLDGVLSDSAWAEAEIIGNFYKSKPQDTSFAESKTEVMMSYDDRFIYVAAICYDELPGKYIVQSLKRDFSYPRSDAFVVFIDPFRDGTNGFSFANNPYGAQREGLLEFGGRFGVTTAWDNKWYSKVKQYKDRWVVEMAIPFKTIRYNSDVSEWKVNFSRNDQKRNETSTWVPVPRNQNVATLAYTGSMTWDEPVKKVGSNVSIIPYISTRVSKDHQEEGSNTNYEGNIGGDVKVGVTSSLNLDLTVNPDYSQVDVDRQVINVDRFEIFFPEKRQFFIENNDMFSNRGFGRSRPFFTRKIGLASDSLGRSTNVPILYGARLSGKIDENWRLGVFNSHIGADKSLGIDAQNSSMAVVQRKLLDRSYVTLFGVHRQGFGSDPDKPDQFNPDDYNSVFGGEARYVSKDGALETGGHMHNSQSFGLKGDQLSTGLFVDYDVKKMAVSLYSNYVGSNYKADLGFVPRKGIYNNSISGQYNMFPKKGLINKHGPIAQYENFLNIQMEDIENEGILGYEVVLSNTSIIDVYGHKNFIELQRNFDPSRVGDTVLLSGSKHHFESIEVRFKSDERKFIFFDGSYETGTYYNGFREDIRSSLRFRFAPIANISLIYNYTDITLPNPYSSREYNLIGTEFEFAFTKSIFFTTFVQYNEQQDNININARFQWRYKPASDLFVVYTDNYFPEELGVKNRALVLKLTYWFNM